MTFNFWLSVMNQKWVIFKQMLIKHSIEFRRQVVALCRASIIVHIEIFDNIAPEMCIVVPRVPKGIHDAGSLKI